MSTKSAGTPVKDRGIMWEETYGEKSAYLKKSYEDQLGPGSYFRWEGHDSTTGEDYYVVVTPGYSKKKGFHFFAALRKIPAKDGASGKKFKTQAEALAHAFKTWRVPPPETRPHKPYIANDLKGIPIVMENVHSSLDAVVIRTSTKTIIDTTKTAGAMGAGASANLAEKDFAGVQDLGVWARAFATLNLTMNPGAAAYATKQILLPDAQGQDEAAYYPDGKKAPGTYVGVATCEPPPQALWDKVMSDKGITTVNKLFKINKKKGEVVFSNPTDQESPEYKKLTFADLLVVEPHIKVRWAAKEAFLKEIAAKQVLQSKIVTDPKKVSAYVISVSPTAEEIAKRKNKSLPANYDIQISCPVDIFNNLRNEIHTAKVGEFSRLNPLEENAIDIYTSFAKTGKLSTPESIEEALRTPVIEEVQAVRNHMIVYDQAGWPISIKVKTGAGIRAGGLPVTREDLQFVFRGGVVEKWMKLPGINGNIEALRTALMTNQIRINREDCVDSRTCAPINRPVVGNYATFKNGIPEVGEDGKIKLTHKKMVSPYSHFVDPKGMIRTYNLETNRDEVAPLPPEVNQNQTVDGIPAFLSLDEAFFNVPDKSGKAVSMSAGQTSLYDPDSKGKFKNGSAYVLMGRPAYATGKARDISRHVGMQIDTYGFFFGHRRQGAEINYIDLAKRGKNTVADIWQQHIPTLHAIMTPQGKITVPTNWDTDPQYKDNPAVIYLKNPSNHILGYYYTSNKAYGASHFITTPPTRQKPIEQSYMTWEKGRLVEKTDDQGNPYPPLVITENDVVVESEGGKPVIYLKNFSKGIDYIKAKFGLTDDQVGPYTNITSNDLVGAYEKASDILKKPETEWNEQERLFMEMYKATKGDPDKIPQGITEQVRKIDPNNPQDFQPRIGPLYQIKLTTGEFTQEVGERTFISKTRAEEIKNHLEIEAKQYPVGTLTVESIGNGPLVSSKDQSISLVQNRKMIGEESYGYAQEYLEPGEVTKEPVPTPETQIPIVEPVQPTVIEPEEVEPIEVPEEIQPVAEPEVQPEPVKPLPPKPIVPKPPPKYPGRSILTPPSESIPPIKSSNVENLVKYANDLDRRGLHTQADAIDTLIKNYYKAKRK